MDIVDSGHRDRGRRRGRAPEPRYAAAEADPGISIALVSKVYPMRSHTVAAEGGSAGVVRDDDSLEHHFNDTVAGGDWLCDQDVVEYFVAQCTAEMIQLEHWGCPWSRKADGHVNVRAFGGMKIERTWFAADLTGFHMLHTLFQTSLKYPSIRRSTSTSARPDGGRRPRAGRGGDRDRHRRVQGSSSASGGHRHRRRGPRLPPEHQRRHRDRRRHGARLPPRRAAARHGIRAVPPDLHARDGPALHRGLPRRGRLLLNKDGYRYLQDYGLGPPDPWPRKKAMELGPARPPLAGLLARGAQGPHDPTPHGAT
jgi:fumarate reductase flavoprotein subunit